MVVSSTERNLYVSMLRQGKSASQILDILNAISTGFNTDVLEDDESQEVLEDNEVEAVAVWNIHLINQSSRI